MKNFHWGKAIALFFIIYIAVLFSVVMKSRTIDHSLVTDDYYAEDLIYQEHYDRVSNQMAYFPDISLDYDNATQSLTIDLKQNTQPIEGEIELYRASNKSEDQVLKVSLAKTDTQVTLEVPNLRGGKWSGLLTWRDDEREYYYKDSFYVVTP